MALVKSLVQKLIGGYDTPCFNNTCPRVVDAAGRGLLKHGVTSSPKGYITKGGRHLWEE